MSRIEIYEYWCELEKKNEKNLKIALENGSAREYQALLNERERIKQAKSDLYKDYKFEVYKNCSHITAAIYQHDYYDRSRTYVKCVKCGLDESVLLDADSYFIPKYSPEERRVMEEFLYTIGDPICGIAIHDDIRLYDSPYEKVSKLYNKMIKDNPNLTDIEFLGECLNKSYINEYQFERLKKEINEKTRCKIKQTKQNAKTKNS